MADPSPTALLVAPPQAGRLDRFLAEHHPELSRTFLQKLVDEGRVLVNGKPAKNSLKLKGAEVVEIDLPVAGPSTDLLPEDLPLDLVYQDADVVVVNKAAGMVVHPARGNRQGTLVNALLHHLPQLRGAGFERPGIVHRIDKGTSGLLVVALHDFALRRLQAQFFLHTTSRRYFAVVHGRPPLSSGRLESVLGRHPRDRLRFASLPPGSKGGRRAVTHWRKAAEAMTLPFALLECKLETGRTHQVRVHLSEAGHPIVGDGLYGSRPHKGIPWPDHPLLHAASLAFDHPVSGERLSFSVPPPADFLTFCDLAALAPNSGWCRTPRSPR